MTGATPYDLHVLAVPPANAVVSGSSGRHTAYSTSPESTLSDANDFHYSLIICEQCFSVIYFREDILYKFHSVFRHALIVFTNTSRGTINVDTVVYSDQLGDERMEEARNRIRKTGKVINVFILILKILLSVFIVAGIGIAVSALLDNNFVKDFPDLFEDNSAFLVNIVSQIDGVSTKTSLIISGIMFALTMSIMLAVVWRIGKVFKEIIDGDTPFTDHLAKELKLLSWLMLIFITYNPLVAFVGFILVRLSAYLFEYGAYIQKRADETNKIQEEMILSFAEITENKSGQTGKHVRRVAEYSKILALELGLDPLRADQLRLASTMHDVGKLLIPKEILEKPGKLTDEEFAEIKNHTTYGGDLLKNVEGDVMHIARTVAIEHHERPDGRGYPSAKALADISIEGKIVAVADVYDALTSKRSYKDAWDDNKAYDEIIKGKGTQFDSDVVDAFERAYEKINKARRELHD